jgi:nucleotide-binding universal stress UspA family protein
VDELLVAYDDSEAAQAALAWTIDFVEQHGGSVLMLYVFSSVAVWELNAVQVNTDPIRRNFQDLLDTKWSEPLRQAGVRFRTKLVVGRPADAILATARATDVSLIVLGMTGRGMLHELIRGATGRHVLHEAQRPVVAVPAGWRRRD